jgi:hypothetical protein
MSYCDKNVNIFKNKIEKKEKEIKKENRSRDKDIDRK